jgi:type II secretory pathway component PulK
MTNQRGSILIISLWTLSIMSFLSINLAGQIQQKVLNFQNIENRGQARLLSESYTRQQLSQLRLWDAHRPFTLRDSQMAGEIGNNQNYTHTTINDQNQAQFDLDDQKQAFYGTMDENRKINVNKADRLTLKRIFQSAGGLKGDRASELASAVLDYRDMDDYMNLNAEYRGSEKGTYHQSGLPYGPKNQDFEILPELLRVPGMTEEIFSNIRNYVTVYGNGRLNLNTASADVMMLIDMDPNLVGKIVTLRSGVDGQAATEDDIAFTDLNLIESQLTERFGLSEQEKISLRHSINKKLVDIGSDYFQVVGQGNPSSARGRIVSVYGVRDGIQYWVET